MIDRTNSKIRIERRGATSVLLCKCCDLPIATLLSDRLVIESKHHSKNHSNSLDLAELEVILQFLRQTNAIIPASRP